jgi:chloramphenicol 3-O-phosphotransferase
MKLEMRTHDLDINVEIDDGNDHDHLQVLEAVQKLVDSVLYCENVSINISSVSSDNDQLAEDELPDADPQ